MKSNFFDYGLPCKFFHKGVFVMYKRNHIGLFFFYQITYGISHTSFEFRLMETMFNRSEFFNQSFSITYLGVVHQKFLPDLKNQNIRFP